MDTRSSGDPAGTEQAGGTRSQGDEGGAAPRLPLHGLRVEAGLWPAARLAGRLLKLLGADVEHAADGRGCLRSGQATVRATADGVAGDWANSGLAELTGRPDGPGLVPDGAPATFARACGLGIELLTTLGGRAVAVDWAGTLSERARILGLTRGGTVSAGGAARLLPTSDGWCALSLPRAADLDLVPALTGGAWDDLGGGAGGNPGDKDSAEYQWGLVRRWARTVTGVEVEARAGLLGLGVGWVRRPGQVRPRPPWSVCAYETDGMRRVRAVHAEGAPPLAGRDEGRRLVVNLGSLWAAPLCAHLLGDGGFRVVDVESPERPDGSRVGTPAFYQRLHAGHELAVLPLATEEGHRELAALLRGADVVITGSRTASLARLGATRDQVSARRAQSWVSITGHGAESQRIGFGDDAAAGGGLLAWDARGPVFAGDAIADPLTGLAAALCAFACLAGGGSWDVRLSLRDVAAASAALVQATGRRLRS